MQCDGCHEDWESDFFCPVCSSFWDTVEVSRPVDLYDGHGDETEVVEEWVNRSFCLNCCPGHASPATVAAGTPGHDRSRP